MCVRPFCRRNLRETLKIVLATMRIDKQPDGIDHISAKDRGLAGELKVANCVREGYGLECPRN
jgi:hypothetical protein